MATPLFIWFYVNSWGREKVKHIKQSREPFPTLLLCVAKQDASSEIGEITHAKANTFQPALSFCCCSLR